VERIKDALLDMHPEKASQPEELACMVLFFLVSGWDIIRPDLTLAIKKFESSDSQHLDILNTATMVLIPRFNGVYHPKGFCHTSIVCSFSSQKSWKPYNARMFGFHIPERMTCLSCDFSTDGEWQMRSNTLK
jgi:hypothetical protein